MDTYTAEDIRAIHGPDITIHQTWTAQHGTFTIDQSRAVILMNPLDALHLTITDPIECFDTAMQLIERVAHARLTALARRLASPAENEPTT